MRPLLALLLCACGSDEPQHDPPADAGGQDAGADDAAVEDAGREAWACACEDDAEDCRACFEKIGTCCYEGDATITGQVDRLIGTCEMNGACAACCNECADKTCEELLAANACPPVIQEPWPWGNGVFLKNGTMQDLAAAPLSTEAIADQEAFQALLDDPIFHKFVSYLVQCALPEGAEVQIGDEVLPGLLGLAPEWADGPCEVACQEWVTACMLSRSNTYGVTVSLYGTSANPSSSSEDDPTADLEQEGAFYGNMFVEPPLFYACRGDGRDPLLNTFRVCTQPGDRCGIAWVGPCGEVDGDTGEPSDRHACEGYDAVHGTYTRCHNRATEASSGEFPEGTRVHERIVTTWVARTAFQEGYADACESEPFLPFAPDDLPGGPGAHCDNDDDCATDQGVFCDARLDHGYCTMLCEGSPDPGAEEVQCGDGATCLIQASGEGNCTAACTPHTRGGDCLDGQVCTNHGLWLPEPDSPGCRPFCSTDADCPPQTPCNRFGSCGFPVDMSLLADGEPCTFPEGETYPEVPCRGACFRVDPARPTLGMCVSIVNTAVTDDCPDDPAMPILTTSDDIGLCMYRRCDVDDECTDPLVCIDSPRGRFCDYAR